MKNCTKLRYIAFISFLSMITLSSIDTKAANGISLYTPYTKISVPPGESVDYSIEVKNSGSDMKKVDLSLSGLTSDWTHTLKAGGYSISQISVLPGESKTISLKIEVPRRVRKGNHSFKVVARNFNELPLVINVSEQGTFKTEFTSDQINMQGHAESNFNFSTKLKNATGEDQVYSLQANPPKGWTVIFKPNNRQATAVEIKANSTTSIYIDVKPPYNIEAGSYKIPVGASNRNTSASLELEVVITGSYNMELTTPTGLLSTKITSGKEKRIELMLKNTGSSELSDVVFRSSKPKDWDVVFEPDTIPLLAAGASVPVFATLKSADKAIPGDYVAKFTAQTTETNSTATFRVSVKTPLLWGWLGILIVLATLGVIYYLFRKYGRR